MWQAQSGFAEMFIEFCSTHGWADYRDTLYEILSFYEGQLKTPKEDEVLVVDDEPVQVEPPDTMPYEILHNTKSEKEDDMEEDFPTTVAKEEIEVEPLPTLPPFLPVIESETPSTMPPEPSQPQLPDPPMDPQMLDLEQWSTDFTVARSPSCPVCGKTFRNRNYVKFHMRMHFGNSEHECRICQRRFPFRSNLERHELVHTGERTFFCCVCNRSFILKHHLTCHMKKAHPEVLSASSENNPKPPNKPN